MSWNADVIFSKTVGFGVGWAQHRLSNTQGMRWKSQEGMSPGLRLPRGPPVTLWLPSHWCQYETASRSTLYNVHSTDPANLFMSTSVSKVTLKTKCRFWYFTDLSAAYVLCRSATHADNPNKSVRGYKKQAQIHKSPFLLKTNYGRIVLYRWLIILPTLRPK